LDATYIDDAGEKRNPVMLHRAILGSLERFVGILIEEFAGSMPPWLSPIQAVVVNITDNQREAVENIAKQINNTGFRVESDLRNEKIGLKIREHSMQRVPYILVVGDREMEEGTVAVRMRGGKELGTLSVAAFMDHLQQDVVERRQV
jgi:threonyl-tRNA synthetase